MTLVRGVVGTDVLRVQTVTRIERTRTVATTGLQPQRFVRSAIAWPSVEASAFDAARMVELIQRRDELISPPTLEKIWAEAIYEIVRCRVLPDAPSRLDCLYAVQVGYDAFDIMPELGLATVTFGPDGFQTSGPAILMAQTLGRWVAVDMRLFQIPESLPTDESALRTQLERTERLAERYWTGEASETPVTELLCEGLQRGP